MDDASDLNRELMVDGNAIAGLLMEIFGADITAEAGQCAHCGNVGPIAALLAFTQAPGVVLRCSVCEQIVLRIVQTPSATYIDARGAAFLRFHRPV